MDGSGTYTIPVPFHPSLVLAVDYNPTLHARTPASAPLEASIQALWSARLASNPALFNGPKFRYAAHTLVAHTLTLHLGLTDYATFVATHGGAPFPHHARASPLGNAALCLTEDGYVVWLVRAGASAEGAGCAGMPGGHPEPGAVVDGGVDGEMWDGVVREVVEEVFVDEGVVGEVTVLGLVERSADGKAMVLFCVPIKAGREEVARTFAEGNMGQEESERILFLRPAEMECVLEKGRLETGESVMPDHVGAVEIALQYFRWKKGS